MLGSCLYMLSQFFPTPDDHVAEAVENMDDAGARQRCATNTGVER